MGDSDDKSQPDVPAWQQAAPPQEADVDAVPDKSQPATLEQARKFLQDPEVQKESTERKAEFLRSKGIPQADIDELLKPDAVEAQPQAEAVAKNPNPNPISEQPPQLQPLPEPEPPTPQLLEKKEDRPPIITYPEFLTKPVRPPPLMTMNGFLNTLYAFGGFSTLLYGTSKYVLEPMVQSLTQARIELHETTKDDLAKLVEKLESVVSELPPTKKGGDHPVHGEEYRDDDEKSSYDDPTELFHRDIGVQTSLPSSPVESVLGAPEEEPASAKQARRLQELVVSVKAVTDGLVDQTEAYGDVKTVLDVFRDDLDKLSAAAGMDYSGFSAYSNASRNEPDDEIKKARDNIRRVKGVLLSTRSFPASTR